MIEETREDEAVRYLFGEMNQSETLNFRLEMERDSELRAFVRSLDPAVGGLGLAVSAITPRPELLRQILTEIRPSSPMVSFSTPGWVPWALAASLALSCGVLVTKQGHLHRELATLKKRDALAQVRIATLGAQVQGYKQVVATIVWNADHKRGLVELKQLPPLDAEHDYQLWVIDPAHATPVSAGVLAVDAAGSTHALFQPTLEVNQAAQFAVSIERKGGGVAPEGPVVLAGG